MKDGANVGDIVGGNVVIPVCEHVVGGSLGGQNGDDKSLLLAYCESYFCLFIALYHMSFLR